MRERRLIDVAERLSHPVLDHYRRQKTSSARVGIGSLLLIGGIAGLSVFVYGAEPSQELTWGGALQFLAYPLGVAGILSGMWVLVSGLSESAMKWLNRMLKRVQPWLATGLMWLSGLSALAVFLLVLYASVNDPNHYVYAIGALFALVSLLTSLGSVEVCAPVLSSDQLEPGVSVRNLRRIVAGTRTVAASCIAFLWFLWAALPQLIEQETFTLATAVTLSAGLLGWSYNRRRAMERSRRAVLEQITSLKPQLLDFPATSREQLCISLESFDDVLVGEVLSGSAIGTWSRAGNDARLITQYLRWRLSESSLRGWRDSSAPVDLKGFESTLKALDELSARELVGQFHMLIRLWAQAFRTPVLHRSARRKIIRERH